MTPQERCKQTRSLKLRPESHLQSHPPAPAKSLHINQIPTRHATPTRRRLGQGGGWGATHRKPAGFRSRQVCLRHTRRAGSLPNERVPAGRPCGGQRWTLPAAGYTVVRRDDVDGQSDQASPMFDSLTIARQLTDAGIDRGHADALADAIRQAAEHGEHVTPERFDAGIAELRTEMTALESRIYRAMLVQAGAIVGAVVGIAGIVFGALRLLG